jgi:hypothetical protein
MRREALLNLLSLAGLVALVGGLAVYASTREAAGTSSAASSTPSIDAPHLNGITPPPSLVSREWEYSSVPDEIRKGDMLYATVASLNELYPQSADPTQLMLQLSRAPGESTSIWLYLDPGKLACEEMFCSLPASFDGVRDTLLFRARPEYGSLAAYDPEGLARRLKQTRRFVVEVGIKDLGTEQFSFNVSGLRWATSRPVSRQWPESTETESSTKPTFPAAIDWPIYPASNPASDVRDEHSAQPQPAQMSTARSVEPIGEPSSWVNAEEFPRRLLGGKTWPPTGFRALIDENGRVKQCSIIQTSGNVELDSLICSHVTKHGRFEPALDKDGKPTETYWGSRVTIGTR